MTNLVKPLHKNGLTTIIYEKKCVLLMLLKSCIGLYSDESFDQTIHNEETSLHLLITLLMNAKLDTKVGTISLFFTYVGNLNALDDMSIANRLTFFFL